MSVKWYIAAFAALQQFGSYWGQSGHSRATLLARVIGSCLYVSLQFGRASAPKCPQRSHRSLGPNDGTGTSSGLALMSRTLK